MTIVLISGANRGLGLEFARQYLADGATVIAGVRRPDAAEALRGLGEAADGRLEIHALDVAEQTSVDSFRMAVGDRPLDIVIAGAGVYGERQGFLNEIDFDSWIETFKVNTLGPVRLAQAFAGHLKRGREKKLVAITSLMGSIADSSGGVYAYRSTKAALNMAFKSVALELKPSGVIAAVLHPGWVQTDMGGPGAPVTPEQSIRGMRQVIAGLTPSDAGSFRAYDGRALPW